MLKSSHIPRAVIDKLAMDGSFSRESLAKALDIMIQSKEKVNLEDVLINDLGHDRHQVYQAFCRIFAFREIKIDPETVTEKQLEFIRTFYNSLDVKSQQAFLAKRLLPYGFSSRNRDIRIIVTPEPTTA